MSTSSTSGRFFKQLFYVLVLAGGLMTGCRSAQTAYQFKPAAEAVAVRPMPADIITYLPSTSAQTKAPVGMEPQAATKNHYARPHLKRQLRQAVAQVQKQLVVTAATGRKSAAQAVRRAAGPRHTTEVGLGTTVLGVLGLVVLPISLIGLLIWGGPVWAVLAGLAALAVLIAYLDPFA
ncbi:hypothetical protein [Hymenobacter pini]|uniref:hypothetical protein n=1 Tax=Hymenobacter pini TaxID=2880879 RepID=UPI001CF1B38F|nr:hypothetical protein [Hymenobacter pini]MCA8832973.1 hypothetical protein [Hymenobacter pini]